MTVVSLNRRLGALESASDPLARFRNMTDEALRGRLHHLSALFISEGLLPEGFAAMTGVIKRRPFVPLDWCCNNEGIGKAASDSDNTQEKHCGLRPWQPGAGSRAE